LPERGQRRRSRDGGVLRHSTQFRRCSRAR
jgi:hypothetical protein